MGRNGDRKKVNSQDTFLRRNQQTHWEITLKGSKEKRKKPNSTKYEKLHSNEDVAEDINLGESGIQPFKNMKPDPPEERKGPGKKTWERVGANTK